MIDDKKILEEEEFDIKKYEIKIKTSTVKDEQIKVPQNSKYKFSNNLPIFEIINLKINEQLPSWNQSRLNENRLPDLIKSILIVTIGDKLPEIKGESPDGIEIDINSERKKNLKRITMNLEGINEVIDPVFVDI